MGIMEKRIPKALREHYLWIKQHSAKEESTGFALEIISSDRIGLLSDITSLVRSFNENVTYIQSWTEYDSSVHTLVQISDQGNKDSITKGIIKIPSVIAVHSRPTYLKIYGKRIIVIGGGAQVAQVASGAVAEADRHNIRGETISVDTAAVVGEEDIARGVYAVGRLHRAAILVLAGALMGGKITEAVKHLRKDYGIPVISLNMAGSVPEEADLVVSDPVQAGVMAVMLISHVGQCNLLEIHGRHY